jgi:hypothetical protein
MAVERVGEPFIEQAAAKRAAHERGVAEELPAVHALLPGGLDEPGGREVEGDSEPAQRIRVGDAPLLDLVDRLPRRTAVAPLLDGGSGHAPGHRGQRQAQPCALFSDQLGQRQTTGSLRHAAISPYRRTWRVIVPRYLSGSVSSPCRRFWQVATTRHLSRHAEGAVPWQPSPNPGRCKRWPGYFWWCWTPAPMSRRRASGPQAVRGVERCAMPPRPGPPPGQEAPCPH